MKYDECGFAHATTEELCDLLYQNPSADISKVFSEDPHQFNTAVDLLYAPFEKLKLYETRNLSREEVDQIMRDRWFIPDEYKNMDIVSWVLDQCKTQEELQRVGEELLMYEERNLMPLLKQLKYVIDIWRENGIVWGVGRGSSVSSYVLYLIGVHRINSMYYDLDIGEFLR